MSASLRGRLARQPSTDLSLLVVNHDIVRLDVAMHDALGVAEIECLPIKFSTRMWLGRRDAP